MELLIKGPPSQRVPAFPNDLEGDVIEMGPKTWRKKNITQVTHCFGCEKALFCGVELQNRGENRALGTHSNGNFEGFPLSQCIVWVGFI